MGVRLAEHVAWREIGGEMFVVDLKAKMKFGLNAAGGQLWKAVEGGCEELSGLGRCLVADASDDLLCDSAERATTAFFGELHELGLVSLDLPAPRSEVEEPPSSDSFVPPEVVWREELRSFALSCAFQPATTAACNAAPSM